MELDTAFEMATSNIRFGRGITREVGMDLKDRGLKRVMVLTDPNLKDSPTVQIALEAMAAEETVVEATREEGWEERVQRGWR